MVVDLKKLLPARALLLEIFLLVLIALVSIDLLIPSGPAIRWGCTIFLALVLFRRAWEYVPIALLIFTLFVGGQWFPAWIWQLPAAPLLIPFVVAWLLCVPFAALRSGYRWFRVGEIDQITWFLVAIVSLVSALALVLWALWTDYLGLATAMMAQIRTVPKWFMLLVGIPGFALINAFAEEVVYRGSLQDILDKKWKKWPWLVLSAQASAFAALHFRAGFPNGKIGYMMTFTYAMMLGYLRLRSSGMLAPYLAHVAADMVIGLTLLLLSS